jgi:hypothetical protein
LRRLLCAALIEDNTVLDAVVYDGLYADTESERNRGQTQNRPGLCRDRR